MVKKYLELKKDYVFDKIKVKWFRSLLFSWFEKNRRDFFWRNINSPYVVLISEIMLQQTTAKQAQEAVKEIIKNYPDIFALSKSEITDLLLIVKKYGLSYRAKRLKKISLDIVNNFSGQIPKESKQLESLYGIGKYISHALQCFAFDKIVPIVDCNVIRLIERFWNIKSKKKRPRNDSNIWNFAEILLPQDKVKEYNWALLDFSAIVCRKVPKCEVCVLKEKCDWVILIDQE